MAAPLNKSSNHTASTTSLSAEQVFQRFPPMSDNNHVQHHQQQQNGELNGNTKDLSKNHCIGKKYKCDKDLSLLKKSKSLLRKQQKHPLKGVYKLSTFQTLFLFLITVTFLINLWLVHEVMSNEDHPHGGSYAAASYVAMMGSLMHGIWRNNKNGNEFLKSPKEQAALEEWKEQSSISGASSASASGASTITIPPHVLNPNDEEHALLAPPSFGYQFLPHLLQKPLELSQSCESNLNQIQQYCSQNKEQAKRCERQTYDAQSQAEELMMWKNVKSSNNDNTTTTTTDNEESSSNFDKMEMLLLSKLKAGERLLLKGKKDDQSQNEAATCKTLWFAGFVEDTNSQCVALGDSENNFAGIRMDYGAALASARAMAEGVLQPVLLLKKQPGHDDIVDSMHSMKEWALQQGAIVLEVSELSFEGNISNWEGEDTDQIGTYVRMDIPNLIRQHKLFDLPNICPRHVLYTDHDVLFASQITHEDMSQLKQFVAPHKKAYIMYGRDYYVQTVRAKKWYEKISNAFTHRTAYPVNTGVLLMDVYRFEAALPDMLDFRETYEHQDKFKPNSFQTFLNVYYKASALTRHERTLLPIYWNWKVYWPLNSVDFEGDNSFHDLKIVHFHGPSHKIAWNIAQCNLDALGQHPEYGQTIADGICCDMGKTADRVQALYETLQPYPHDVC